MFRKPKSKINESGSRNIRKRNDEELPGVMTKESNGQVIDDLKNGDDRAEIQKEATKTKTGLSFNEEEGDDVVNFKLKKNISHHKRSTTSQDKPLRRKQKPFGQRLGVDSTKDVKKEKIEVKNEPEIVLDGENENQNVENNSKEEEKFANKIDAEIRGAFPSTFAGIPDAKAVYEARKKREMMRLAGASDGEYIPLVDDTIRLKSSNDRSGERARLIREDENDISDEEETGSFYSAKKLLQNEEDRRREEQAHFLEIEQGSSDEEEKMVNKKGQLDSDEEEEDDLHRWEREQIRKGVSSNKVLQMQCEMNAISMHFRGHGYMAGQQNFEERIGGGEAEMDIDMDIEMLEGAQQMMADAKLGKSQATASAAMMRKTQTFQTPKLEDILGALAQRIADKREKIASREAELTRVSGHIEENTEMIHKLELGMPELERKLYMLQDEAAKKEAEAPE